MIFATDASTLTPWVAGGSATALLTIAIALIFRQVAQLLRDNQRCNRRLGILFRLCVTNKLDIPAAYWDEVHEAVNEPLTEVTVRRRRGR